MPADTPPDLVIPWPSAEELAAVYPSRPIAMLRDGRLALILETAEQRPDGMFRIWLATDDGAGLLPADHGGSHLLVRTGVLRRFDQVPDHEVMGAWRAYDQTRERLAKTPRSAHDPVVHPTAEAVRLQAEVDKLRAEIDELRAEVARLSTPDTFWDAANAETSYPSVELVIDDYPLGAITEIGRAHTLPTVWLVTVGDDIGPRAKEFSTSEEAEAWLAAQAEAAP